MAVKCSKAMSVRQLSLHEVCHCDTLCVLRGLWDYSAGTDIAWCPIGIKEGRNAHPLRRRAVNELLAVQGNPHVVDPAAADGKEHQIATSDLAALNDRANAIHV